MSASEQDFIMPAVPMDFTYNYRIGPYMTRFLEGFRDRKIVGSRCGGCRKVAVPPRKYCGVCNRVMDEFVELPQEGTLENFTVGHVTLEKGRITPSESPYILGLVKLEDGASLLLARVEGADPAEVSAGMKVRAVWKEQVEGDYGDLDHFEPA